MASSTAEEKALTRAYAVFRTELEMQIAAAKAALAVPPQGAEKLPELRIVFHRVKGGAGFFGLDSIARQAAELERLMQEPLASLQQHLGEARDLVRQLEESFQGLPPANANAGKKDA